MTPARRALPANHARAAHHTGYYRAGSLRARGERIPRYRAATVRERR